MNSPNPLLPPKLADAAPLPSRRPLPLKLSTEPVRTAPPELVLSPLAFLKLQFFLHAGDTEVGGFGVSRGPGGDDLLYVEDFVTLAQQTTCVTVEFDDAAVADHFDQMNDAGRTPAECGRVWVHTHPGASPDPSGTDERTFARAFGHCDWSVMLIVARGGRTYARLQFAAGPRATVLLPVRVDWASWATTMADLGGDGLGALAEEWMDEYGANVRPVSDLPLRRSKASLGDAGVADGARVLVESDTLPFDDRDRIADPDADWWELDDELAALAELEAADYFGGVGGGFRERGKGVFG